MLAGFFSWWLARITEVLPTAWTKTAAGPRDGLIVEVDDGQTVTLSIRRGGRCNPVGLGAAARQAGSKPILLRPPPGVVLVKHHTIPTVPHRQLGQLLRHELGRITPFPATELFWCWEAHARPNNRARTDVVLTMVPRKALAPALAVLESIGLQAHGVEVGAAQLLAIGDGSHRTAGGALGRGLARACPVLVAVALGLPLVLQAVALSRTESAIAALQPVVTQVQALRRDIASGDAGRGVLAQEMERTGDVLQILATVTRLLPDDTFLTDFSLRDRQMTLSGRSASAARLITGLSADATIRNTAFTAPVTRIDGTSADLFSIKAEVAK